MNDTLAPARSLDSARLLLPAAEADGAHLTLAARFELRLGLWLLLRSARRNDSARDRDDHSRRAVNARSLNDRHHHALRAHALNSVRT
jgi:hypothetical protein